MLTSLQLAVSPDFSNETKISANRVIITLHTETNRRGSRTWRSISPPDRLCSSRSTIPTIERVPGRQFRARRPRGAWRNVRTSGVEMGSAGTEDSFVGNRGGLSSNARGHRRTGVCLRPTLIVAVALFLATAITSCGGGFFIHPSLSNTFINPASATLAKSKTTQLSVVGMFSDGSQQQVDDDSVDVVKFGPDCSHCFFSRRSGHGRLAWHCGHHCNDHRNDPRHRLQGCGLHQQWKPGPREGLLRRQHSRLLLRRSTSTLRQVT